MESPPGDKPRTSKLKKWLRYIDENSKWMIYTMMIGFMVVAAGAFWLNVAYKSRHDIHAALYAAGIVLSLVFRFTGLFKRNSVLIVVIIMLTLIFLLAYLY
jgi:hypothetical protein